MRDEEQELGLQQTDGAQDLPRVVEEAHEVLTSYSWQLLALAGAVLLGWLGSGIAGAWLSPFWLMLPLLILVALFLAPVAREPRLARDVLRRWDQLRVERALESSGFPTDPRLEVAESMADRVVRHPSSDERIRLATTAMIVRLRRLLHDLRRIDHLSQTQVVDERRHPSRSMSDLQDVLDARVADILGQLAQLHRTVVLRDTSSLERVVSEVEELVRSLEAEREVEQLLSNAERES